MKTSSVRHFLFLSVLLGATLIASAGLALMPPHVTGTNIKEGVLHGEELVIRGYSLGYSDLDKDLSVTRTKGAQAVKHKRNLTCTMEGDCKSDRPGSCQERCELKLTLTDVKHHASYKVRFLGLNQLFKVVLTPAKPKKSHE